VLVGLYGGELAHPLPPIAQRAIGIVGSYVGKPPRAEGGGGAGEKGKLKPIPVETRARGSGGPRARRPESREGARPRGAGFRVGDHCSSERTLTMTPFSWNNPYAWPRRPVLAENAVATSQPLAAQAGLQMLAAGGTAVDAALATAITLTLVEPVSNGIGSTPTPSSGTAGQLHGLNASGRSPAGWTPSSSAARKRCRCAAGMPSPFPGCVSAWLELHGRFGKLPFEKLFETAIRYGREGFLVSPTIAGQWEKQVPELKAQPGFAEAFMPGGRAPRPGERFRFRSTRRLSSRSRNPEAMRSTGEPWPKKSKRTPKKHGGAMRAEDLAAHRADWVTPLAIDYRGYTLHELPPNGQGNRPL